MPARRRPAPPPAAVDTVTVPVGEWAALHARAADLEAQLREADLLIADLNAQLRAAHTGQARLRAVTVTQAAELVRLLEGRAR